MNKHTLKTLQPYFDDVASGAKTFEIRRNDRGFQVGDTLVLREYVALDKENTTREHLSQSGFWDSDGYHTGREITRTVSYVFQGGAYGLAEGFCVLGLSSEIPDIGECPKCSGCFKKRRKDQKYCTERCRHAASVKKHYDKHKRFGIELRAAFDAAPSEPGTRDPFNETDAEKDQTK